MSPLEQRYRRLLVLYPSWHRSMYAEEMITVLLSGAAPGRSRPAFRDLADIAVSALTVRFRRGVGDLGSDAWRQAAYLVLVAGSILMAALGARRAASAVTGDLRFPGHGLALDSTDVLRVLLWVLVAVAAVGRLRRAAGLLAVVAAGAEVVRMGSWFATSPPSVLRGCWQLAAALMVVLAAVWLQRAGPLSWPRSGWALGLAGLVVVGSGPAEWLPGWSGGGGLLIPTTDETQPYTVWSYLFLFWLAVVALLVWTWWRQPAAVRARVLAFGAPVLAIAVLIPYAFSGYFFSSAQFQSPIPLAPVQWVLLIGVPVLAFAVAVVAVHRAERIQHLIRLGQQAESRAVSRSAAGEM